MTEAPVFPDTRHCRNKLSSRWISAFPMAAAVMLGFSGGGANAGVETPKPASPLTLSLVESSATNSPGRTGKPPSNDRSAPRDDALPTFSTGVFVAKGHLIANADMVEGCDKVQLSYGGRSGDGRVVARDRERKLALIRTTMPTGWLALFDLDPQIGETVSVYGIALSFMMTSTGNFSQGELADIDGAGLRLRIAAPIAPFSWGGPVLNQNGGLLGVIVSGVSDEHDFAVKGATVTDSRAIADFLREYGVTAADKNGAPVKDGAGARTEASAKNGLAIKSEAVEKAGAHEKEEADAAIDPTDIADYARSMSATVLCMVKP